MAQMWRLTRKQEHLMKAISVLIFLISLPLGMYIGTSSALVVLSKINSLPGDHCFLERAAIAGGVFLGIVYALFIAAGGRFLYREVVLLFQTRKAASKRAPFLKVHPRTDPDQCDDIRNRLQFLKPYYKHIHAVLLVGSAAYRKAGKGSDVDIVVVCRTEGYEIIKEIVAQEELQSQIVKEEKTPIEYTVLDTEAVQEEYRLSTPFSYSMRYAVPLYSDGYIESLNKRYPQRIPRPGYVLRELYNGVFIQYYGSLRDIQRDIRHKHIETEVCQKQCVGHGHADRFINAIVRMLYLSLSLKGYIPLTKTDLRVFGEFLYSSETVKAIDMALTLIHEGRSYIYESEFNILKRLADMLFLDIVQTLGFNAEIKHLINDAISLVKGDLDRIHDPSYRRCMSPVLHNSLVTSLSQVVS